MEGHRTSWKVGEHSGKKSMEGHCQNHSVDDAVHARTKGLVLRGKTVDRLHTLKEERRERRGVVNASRGEQR